MKKIFLFYLFSFLFAILRADLTIDGNGGSIDLSSTFSLGVSAGTELTLRNLTVNNLSGDASTGRLVMHHSTSQLVLQNSILSLDGDYTFTEGSLVIEGDCEIIGEGDFTFEGHNILIDNNATLKINGLSLILTPTYESRQLIKFGNFSSKILLDNGTLKVSYDSTTDNGLLLIGGNL